jgi:hypothetical protein
MRRMVTQTGLQLQLKGLRHPTHPADPPAKRPGQGRMQIKTDLHFLTQSYSLGASALLRFIFLATESPSSDLPCFLRLSLSLGS